jgi:hypothetical protein
VHKRLLEVVAAEVRHTMGDHPEYAASSFRAMQMESSIAKRVVGALAVEFNIELRSERGTGAK